jgi:hypothetical protein
MIRALKVKAPGALCRDLINLETAIFLLTSS